MSLSLSTFTSISAQYQSTVEGSPRRGISAVVAEGVQIARHLDQTFGPTGRRLIAYETPAREGMVVSEDIIVEIVKSSPVPVGERELGAAPFSPSPIHRPTL